MTLADLMRQHRLTDTRVEGYTPDGRCRGCGARPAHHIVSSAGGRLRRVLALDHQGDDMSLTTLLVLILIVVIVLAAVGYLR